MRVLQLVARHQARGAEVFALQLANALRAHASCKIAYLYRSAAMPRTDDGTSCYLDYGEDHWSERIVGVNLSLLRRLAAIIRQYDPSIIQLNGSRTVKYGTLLRRLQPGARWRVVYRNIGEPRAWVATPARRRMMSWLLSGVDGTIAVSASSEAALLGMYPRLRHVRVIHNGIDPDAIVPLRPRASVRSELAIAANAPVVLFVGSLSREKRPDLAMHVFAHLHSEVPSAVFCVAGDGSMREELVSLAEQLNVAHATRFLGIVADVGGLMRASDVLLLTSDTEGVPAVVLEAAYHRLPTVATHVGGVPECVVDGTTGLLAAKGSSASLTQALRRLVDDPNMRVVMGQNAHEYVTERFTMDRISAQYREYYSSLLHG